MLWLGDMELESRKIQLGRGLRSAFVVLIIGLFLAFFFLNIYSLPPKIPFEKWYGNWPAVFMATGVFLFFIFFLTRPRTPREWRGAGLTGAFFISLFTEMFGIPLTVYLLAPALGVKQGIYGMHESHLWAYLLSLSGVVNMETGLYVVMVFSTGLLLLGFTLLALGWKEVFRGENALVTNGLYAKLRHSQYLGLVLIVVAFLIQWPTLLTLFLAPFLIARYVILAKEEDVELEGKFGDDFKRYRKAVPGFIPFFAARGAKN